MPRLLLCVATAMLLPTAFSAPIASAADWPQWRGPERTDISKETGLLKAWPSGGPSKVWMSREGGLGYSGMAVVGDMLYTMGADGGTEYLIALSSKDGKKRWSQKIGSLLTNNWGDGPRGTPTVVGDLVYAMSGQGNLYCVDAKTGRPKWNVSMSKLGGRRPGWGYTESVLVDDGKVLCTPGGKQGAIAALDAKSGKLIWQSKDFKEGAQYSSIIAVEHAGKRQYIQLTMKKLVGLDAKTGDVLWTNDWPGATAVIPTPIYRDGHVFITSGYNVGCKLVRIDENNNAVGVYRNKDMVNHHGGVVLVGEHLYGYSDRGGWTCMEFKSGKVAWQSRKLDKGCLTYADGMLYLVGERSGDCVLIEASPEGWSEKGRFKITPQTKQRKKSGRIWTHPTVANGKLYLRDQELVFSYDIAGK